MSNHTQTIKEYIKIKDLLTSWSIPAQNNSFRAFYRKDNNPSVIIGTSKEGYDTYKDLTTNEVGTVIDLYMKYNNVTLQQAIKEMLEICQSPTTIKKNPNQIQQPYQNQNPNQNYNYVNGKNYMDIFNHLVSITPIHGVGLGYMSNIRKLDIDTLKAYKIGYIDNQKSTYYRIKNSLTKKFDLNRLKECGLFNEKGNFKGFLNCVLIPYLDYLGNAVYIQFRCLNETNGKYRLLQKVQPVPFMFNATITALQKSKDKNLGTDLYITEGAIDALTILQSGEFAIGLVSSTKELNGREIKQIVDVEPSNIYICKDPDSAGDRVSTKIATELHKLNPNLNIHITNLKSDINQLNQTI